MTFPGSLVRGFIFASTVFLSSPASAEYIWNDPISANGTDTVNGDVGNVGFTITDNNSNNIQVIAFVNVASFPSVYNISGIQTFQESLGSNYTMTFDEPIDNPTIAVGSLGSWNTRNRFSIVSVDGNPGAVDITFAEANPNIQSDDDGDMVNEFGEYCTSSGCSSNSEGLHLTNVTYFESREGNIVARVNGCLLYTSDAADEHRDV